MTWRSRNLGWPDPELRDGDIRLRPWEVSDAAVLAAAWNDPVIIEGATVPETPTEAYAQNWISRAQQRVDDGRALDLVVTNDTNTVLGEVGAVVGAPGSGDAEIGYWIGEEFRGQGFGQRAVALFADWLLASDGLNMKRLAARTSPSNFASAAVLRSARFVSVGLWTPEVLIWQRLSDQISSAG